MTISQLNFNWRKLIFFFTVRLGTLDAVIAKARGLQSYKQHCFLVFQSYVATTGYARRNDNVPFFLE